MDKAGAIIAYIAAWVKELIYTFFHTQEWLEKMEGKYDALKAETTTEA